MKNKKWSISMRIYHWANALVVILIIMTVALRKSVLDVKNLHLNISKLAGEIGLELTKEQSVKIAQGVQFEVWEMHYYFGFALAFLMLVRIVLFFTQSGGIALKDALSYFSKNKKDDYWIKALYLLVYLAIITMSITGIAMYFAVELDLSDQMLEGLESVHVGVMNIVVYFIPFHIIGVVLAENEDQKGITSDMINGGEK
jgi:Ni/Fe-hydrogenase 1 B-type cytochrome subunit